MKKTNFMMILIIAGSLLIFTALTLYEYLSIEASIGHFVDSTTIENCKLVINNKSWVKGFIMGIVTLLVAIVNFITCLVIFTKKINK